MGNRLPLQSAKRQKGERRIVKVPYKMTLALTEAKKVQPSVTLAKVGA